MNFKLLAAVLTSGIFTMSLAFAATALQAGRFGMVAFTVLMTGTAMFFLSVGVIAGEYALMREMWEEDLEPEDYPEDDDDPMM